MAIIIFLEMYFWLLLEAGIVNKSLAVKPGGPGFKPQFTSNMTFRKPLTYVPSGFTAVNKRGCVCNNNAYLSELL